MDEEGVSSDGSKKAAAVGVCWIEASNWSMERVMSPTNDAHLNEHLLEWGRTSIGGSDVGWSGFVVGDETMSNDGSSTGALSEPESFSQSN